MKYTILSLFVLLFISCNVTSTQTEPIDFTAQNEEEILKYIADNNLDAERSASGLYYVVENLGEGEQPTTSSDVTVAYKGFFTNENVFDESDSSGITFNLQQVIPGWTEGMTYFREGGNGILLIPSRLGYGNSDFNGIPGGSVLIFEVTLLNVQ